MDPQQQLPAEGEQPHDAPLPPDPDDVPAWAPVPLSPTDVLVKMDPKDDPESFLIGFEHMATLMRWNRRYWSAIVAPFLTGDALKVMRNIPLERLDYDYLKQQILVNTCMSSLAKGRKIRLWQIDPNRPIGGQIQDLQYLIHSWFRGESIERIIEKVAIDVVLSGISEDLCNEMICSNVDSLLSVTHRLEGAQVVWRKTGYPSLAPAPVQPPRPRPKANRRGYFPQPQAPARPFLTSDQLAVPNPSPVSQVQAQARGVTDVTRGGTQAGAPGRRPRRGNSAAGTERRCFRCDESGHLARECCLPPVQSLEISLPETVSAPTGISQPLNQLEEDDFVFC
ncbi:uncharacterized protein LOC114642132 [Erpetoichthys calabaricus]|uniref:uncharacterized protein LOC114642132 n=1 Tax=Erpetoichthys calabaricus TaxID=27687 RepID=UPI0022340981|nr:uncharacterized protein LOC114642132 [Erpetoichthys calabaricus]